MHPSESKFYAFNVFKIRVTDRKFAACPSHISSDESLLVTQEIAPEKDVVAKNTHLSAKVGNSNSKAPFELFYMRWNFNGSIKYKLNTFKADGEPKRRPTKNTLVSGTRKPTHFESGVMFQVKAKRTIKIKGFRMAFRHNKKETVRIYTKGGKPSVRMTKNQWKYMGDSEVDARNGVECGCFSKLEMENIPEVKIKKGRIRTFYISVKDNRNLLISNFRQKKNGEIARQNKDAFLFVGSSVEGDFGTTYPNWEFIGSLDYDIL
mmetsp:Transcript_8450/g.18550  ORF Transcript_8450/g.18550 Transcript_8450/m.18550 type:complete len:263 (-) Transcript_8450:242-1030(-)